MSDDKKKILVTGNQGYIGSVLKWKLRAEGYPVIGWDFKSGQDIRKITFNMESELQQVDTIIHLAALTSNPLGEAYPEQTYEINHKATIRLAEKAKELGIKRFIFPSGLSIYGHSETPYSKSKFLAESDLMRLINDQFTVVVLRPGVVYGPSPTMRYDTVLNHFVFTSEMIVKGDGSSLIPIIHIDDLCQTFIAALNSDSGFFNVEAGYFTVNELKEAVCKYAPAKSGNTLYQPKYTLEQGIKNLVKFYENNK